MADHARVIGKVIKRLQSPDDNDKLAALVYLTKAFPTPVVLASSPLAKDIWLSLRSTQFLERALHSCDTQPLVFSVLSVFAHIAPRHDLEPFVPILASLLPSDFSSDPSNLLIEFAASIEDVSVFFDSISPIPTSLSFLTKLVSAGTSLSATPSVFRARSIIFSFLTGREDLSVREQIFRLISASVRLNDSFALYKSKSQLEFTPFLAAERLALIELRLQLDIPLTHSGDDGNSSPFTQQIGKLVNPGISAAASEMLDLLVAPLVNHEAEIADSQIDQYFESVNCILHDSFEIVTAAKGKRDKERVELQCLLGIIAKWLMEAPFLCAHEHVARSLPQLVQLLMWFPAQAVHFVPAFGEMIDKRGQFRAGGFSELARKMVEFASDEERRLIDQLVRAFYDDRDDFSNDGPLRDRA
jgi:hypothetical protein